MYKGSIITLIGEIEKKTVFIAIVIAFSIAYFVNPLSNIDLEEWNRTFSTAVLSGISINMRIGNFYKLLFLVLPLLVGILTCTLNALFKCRKHCVDIYFKLSVFISVETLASYISRYTGYENIIKDNPMLLEILFFLVILTILSLMDKKQQLCFKDVVMLFVAYMISVATFSMLFGVENILFYIIFLGMMIIIFAALFINAILDVRILKYLRCFVCMVAWIPALIRVALEGIYILTEKGHGVERYYTHITRATFVIIVVFALISLAVHKKEWNFSKMEYLGAVVSFTVLGFFRYSYQYIFSYSSMANIYELGNKSVALDTYLYGKVPIIDYFSAHALSDIWTNLVYCFVNGDIKGILVSPYEGLSSVIAFVILFYIVNQIFDEDIAILYVLLFPGTVIGIKWISVCSISIALLLHILKKHSIKAYYIFWVGILVSAFNTYDEGICLGLACIMAYVISCIFEKSWARMWRFIFVGASVGSGVLVLYCCYAMTSGIAVIGRMKEWMAVSVKSNSVWATDRFGDPSSFAFLVAYFIVPATAVMILIFAIARYVQKRINLKLVILTIVFSLTEILFITRTIVFHNLAICSGVTGVLLNFIHWTVSIYILYLVTDKGKVENARIIAFIGSMMAVILIEGMAVTKNWPSADSALLSKGINAISSWELKDDMSYNKEQPRIVYDEETLALVNSFQNLFDTLMTENQTFIDFANITSMYLMTGRVRPFYVGQSPSLLTDLYSQECFMEEISKYDCPLAVLGTTETSYLQQMTDIPHNIRYYKVAEYIYSNYRPLIKFDEFAIWCRKDCYNEYYKTATENKLTELGYILIDYGYDFTTSHVNEGGSIEYVYEPYHSFNLRDLPYVWANFDNYNAADNEVLVEITSKEHNVYHFEGSECYVNEDGNYLSFCAINASQSNINGNVVLYDSSNEGARMQYDFNIKPGNNEYLVRISEDYFWDVFNIDTILFGIDESVAIQNIKILEGD